MRKTAGLMLLFLLVLSLSGCRTRIVDRGGGLDVQGGSGGAAYGTSEPGDGEETEGEETRENPEAAGREFDEKADAEIEEGQDRSVHGPGEGDGYALQGEDDTRANQLSGDAGKTAKQTLTASEAEAMGISADGDAADSLMTYYEVLLAQRTASLFECKKLNVYWESEEDHVTVFRKSREHEMILMSGAYDVSSRLLEENLKVTDDWVTRKNPGVILKVSDEDAESVVRGLLNRAGWKETDAAVNHRVLVVGTDAVSTPKGQLVTMLRLAKMANPDLFEDVDPDRVLQELGGAR